MNKQLQDFARAELKTGLAELPEESHRTFKLMYARDNGKRSVVDAVAMPINDVVDLMPPEQLDWAMQQVQASLDKMHNAELTCRPGHHGRLTMRHPTPAELHRLFQARMWREYAMGWDGRKTMTGVGREWVETILRVPRAECLRRAREALTANTEAQRLRSAAAQSSTAEDRLP